jgi:hypothetical protein
LEGLGPEDEDEAERLRLERQERAAAKCTQKMLRQVGRLYFICLSVALGAW